MHTIYRHMDPRLEAADCHVVLVGFGEVDGVVQCLVSCLDGAIFSEQLVPKAVLLACNQDPAQTATYGLSSNYGSARRDQFSSLQLQGTPDEASTHRFWGSQGGFWKESRWSNWEDC